MPKKSRDRQREYWRGKRVKHLDSVPQLAPSSYPLLRIREVAKKTLEVRSDVAVAGERDIGRFLRKCSYVSDKDQFGARDYWQTPEEFESTKQGDCEDFALWCWRKMVDLGEDARFTYGAGDMSGHAWVTLFRDNEPFVFECTARPHWGGRIRVFSAYEAEKHEPIVSIDSHLRFYWHRR